MIHSKAYFGQLFDFGVEPNSFNINFKNDNRIMAFGDGTTHIIKNAETRARYDIEFKGVSDSIATSFKNKVAHKINPRAYGCCAFLLTQTDHQLLSNHEIAHVNITSYDFVKVYNDYNIVRLECEELE